jgi:hypothetical protein
MIHHTIEACLPQAKQNQYHDIKESFWKKFREHTKRYMSAKSFDEMIKDIKDFVLQEITGAEMRAFVCGMWWCNPLIFLNVKKLELLMPRCKSAINGYFEKTKYLQVPHGSTDEESAFQLFKDQVETLCDAHEWRSWTIRRHAIDPLSAVIPDQDPPAAFIIDQDPGFFDFDVGDLGYDPFYGDLGDDEEVDWMNQ